VTTAGLRDQAILEALAGGWWARRLAPRITPTGDGCQVWTGATDTQGRPRAVLPGVAGHVTTQLIRVAWLAAYGTPPAGALRRTCDRPLCVAVEHLVVAGYQVPASPRLGPDAVTCGRGHPMTGPDARVRPHRPDLECAACHLEDRARPADDVQAAAAALAMSRRDYIATHGGSRATARFVLLAAGHPVSAEAAR
jgi:hypothetical protein